MSFLADKFLMTGINLGLFNAESFVGFDMILICNREM